MKTAPPEFTLMDHTADLGIKVVGHDLKDLFEGAAMSLMSLMVKHGPPQTTVSMKTSVEGVDLADVLVRFLGEILYILDGEYLVVTSATVDAVSPSRVEATLETVPFDPQIHEILHEIKAVTYHQVKVANEGGRWEASVIFDV